MSCGCDKGVGGGQAQYEVVKGGVVVFTGDYVAAQSYAIVHGGTARQKTD